MELVNEIVEARNFWEAWMSVRRNKGASGIDKMSVDVLDVYMPLHMDAIKQSICRKQYKPSPVEGTEKVPFFYDQNGKCLRFVTSLSANRLNKAKIDRK